MQKTGIENRPLLILVLGAMTALSPFSIDMYLPAFSDIARDFKATVPQVTLSLSSYFIGISVGQLLYGPLLDRYGRKKPLYVGLVIYILASLACPASGSTQTLVIWRLIQAFGGCAAGVTSMAMVRDLFEPRESAKIFSLLILILGASPLLAPTIGGYLTAIFGWHSVFLVLAAMAGLLLLAVRFYLPESHQPDRSVSLQIGPVLKGFWEILIHPQFYTYALSVSLAFSGLFVYLAGSPTLFLGLFGIDSRTYGWIFAFIAIGFILSSQLNVLVLRRFSSVQVLRAGLCCQVLVGLSFFLGATLGWFGVVGSVLMFFLFLSCFGFVNPNASAMVLAPFPTRAGRASALLGFVQMGVGAIASSSVGFFNLNRLAHITGVIAGTSLLGLIILTMGEKLLKARR